jgi:PAS domain S-box-containing protein
MPERNPSFVTIPPNGEATDQEQDDLAALREAVARLREENARLRTTVEHMTDAFWAVDHDWHLTYVNAAAERIWGRTREELLGRHIWEEFPAVVGTANHQAIARAMTQRTIEDFEDFSPALGLWVAGRAYPTEYGLAVHFQDITRHLAEERARRESEERYRAVLESIDEGFCVIEVLFDENGAAVDYRYLETNPAFELQTGLRDATGKTARELVPDLSARWFEIYGKVASTGEPVRFVDEAQAMGGRWFDVYAFRLDDDSRTVALLFSNITERRRVEMETARLAAIVEDSRDAIIGCALDGAIVQWNRGAEALFGYSAEEVVGQDIAILIPPDRMHERFTHFERLQAGESVPPQDTVRIHKNGAAIDVEVRLSPITDADGQIVGVSAIDRDVTERKRLERVQQDFVAMASHDLTGPVTVLRARAHLMQRRQAYDEASVETILEQTQRMDRLITDLRELVQLETGRLEMRRAEHDLIELARAAVERARIQSTRHTIRLEHAESPVSGSWDGDRLGQVLDNLLGNAVKYSPPGSEVVLSVSASGDVARVRVSDQGEGVAPDAVPHLFERFYRGEQRGSAAGLGLGLYITRMLVEAHGGRVWVETEPGKGSTFTFAVPREPAAH